MNTALIPEKDWQSVRRALAANPFGRPPTPPRWSHPDAVRALTIYALIVIFAVAVAAVLFFPPPEKSFSQDVMLVLITALVTKLSTTVDYWHGSSDRKGPSGKPEDPVSTTVENAPEQAVPVEAVPQFTEPVHTGPQTTGDG